MQALNFPKYKFKLKSNENKVFIFDIIRKKYLVLTPEEWVRQHILHFLIYDMKYPISLIAVERQIRVNSTNKRFDILVFNTDGLPNIIVECKAPSVRITQETFDQLARYNMTIDANFFMVSNGLDHYFCTIDHQNKRYQYLKTLPKYSTN